MQCIVMSIRVCLYYVCLSVRLQSQKLQSGFLVHWLVNDVVTVYLLPVCLAWLQAPVLKYLFYLARVGVTTSIISNMSGTRQGSKVPLMDYLTCGLLVSLSTHQPVFTHMTTVSVHLARLLCISVLTAIFVANSWSVSTCFPLRDPKR